ncbi:hypothetical protein JCM8547_000629 [Rhodosporidiobolus lusitaniae]
MSAPPTDKPQGASVPSAAQAPPAAAGAIQVGEEALDNADERARGRKGHQHDATGATGNPSAGQAAGKDEGEHLQEETTSGQDAGGKKRSKLSVLFTRNTSPPPAPSSRPTSRHRSHAFYEPFEHAHSAKKSGQHGRPSVDFEHARPILSSPPATSPPMSPTASSRSFFGRRKSRGSHGESGRDKPVLLNLKMEKAERDKWVDEGKKGKNGATSPTSPARPPSGFGNGHEEEETRSLPIMPISPVPDEAGKFDLTPQDRHYINRMLVNLQLQHEFGLLSQIGTLAKYDSPFLPHANGPNSRPPAAAGSSRGSGFLGFGGGGKKEKTDPHFAGYVWDKDKVQDSPINQYLFWRFIYNAPALRSAKPIYWTDQIQPFFDSFAERDLSSTVERGEVTKRRMLALGIVRILGTYYSNCLKPLGASAPSRPSSSMMNSVDLLVPGGMESMWRILRPDAPTAYNAWVAVVEGNEREGERTFRIVSQVVSAPDKPLYFASRSWTSVVELSSSLAVFDPDGRLSLPTLPSTSSSQPASRSSVQHYLRLLVISLSSPHPSLRDSALLLRAREKLEAFLLSDGKDGFGEAEWSKLVKRGVEEEKRDDEEHRHWVQVGLRVKRLRSTWLRYRRALIETDELDKTIAHAKKTSRVDQLPQAYQDAEEWARIWVAYALHYIFVAARTGPEVFNILRSFHSLIPYGPVKVGLAVVNPTIAIKAVVQLILGQPMGQQSLFQRIWSHVCLSANKHQNKLIETFRKKVGNDAMSNALRDHVAAPYVERQKTKETAIERNEDIVLTILRERGTSSDAKLVADWYQEFAQEESLPSYDAAEASVGARKFGELKELLAAYYRHRDRLQVLEIALEPGTPKLLHASIAVFYDTIRDVANASKLADRVGDIQAFLNDLVAAVESGKSAQSDFINLVDRHHQSLYFFLHELAKAPGLLDPVINYAKSGLDLLDSGIPSSAPATEKRAGTNVEALLARLSSGEQKEILRETWAFASWTAFEKVRKDVQLRCDLLRAASSSSTSASTATSTSSTSSCSSLLLDPNSLWQDFLAQSSPADVKIFHATAKAQQENPSRTGPGGDLDFAWWAARELAGAAGKGVVKAHMESAKETVGVGGDEPVQEKGRKEKVRRGLTTRSSSSSATHAAGFSVVDLSEAKGYEGAEDATNEDELAVPSPLVERTRNLLAGYLEQVKSALSAARQNGVK